MIKKNFITVFFTVISFGISCAQFVDIPDPKFKAHLQNVYPHIFNESGLLIIDSAATITDTLKSTRLEIESAEGIQYFTGLAGINFTNNRLTSFPDVRGITGLLHFQVDSNQITSLPSFAGMSNMDAFKCDNNLLTELPDLSGCTTLNRLFCRYNRLPEFPDLEDCVNLDKIICTYNLLTELPDFVNNPKLDRVIVHHNFIRDIADYSGHPSLTSMLIMNNQMTFESILKILNLPQYTTAFDYLPQDSIKVAALVTGNEKHSLTIDLNIDQSVADNTYKWFKNDTLIATTSTSSLSIPEPSFNDSGKYHCTFTNPNAPSVELTTTHFQVVISPCLISENPEFTIENKSCKTGYNLFFDEATITFGVPPFSYSLKLDFSDKTFEFNTSQWNQLTPGNYQLSIIDQLGCNFISDSKFNLPVIANCEDIFTPNGDGDNDTYYFDKSGSIEIYNTQGKLVTQFSAPSHWNGTDKNGSLVPIGNYAIYLNGAPSINLSVVY